MRRNDIPRAVFAYSIIVFFMFVAKILLMASWGEFADWISSTSVGDFADVYVQPAVVPIWQISAFVISILATGLFLYAGIVLFRIENNEAWSATRARESFEGPHFSAPC